MPRELPFDRRAIADQQQSDLKMSGRDQGAINDGSRPLVAAHRIDGDPHHFKVLQGSQGSAGFYKVRSGFYKVRSGFYKVRCRRLVRTNPAEPVEPSRIL